MSTHTEELQEHALRVADTVRSQVHWSAFGRVGAHRLRPARVQIKPDAEPMVGLCFDAVVLPFDPDGTRSLEACTMQCFVLLDEARDTYTLLVCHVRGGESVRHYFAEGLYCDQLTETISGLDSDGPEPVAVGR